MRAYNPARKQTTMVTKGHPFYTLDVIKGDCGSVQVVGAEHVAEKNKKGKKKILSLIVEIYLESAQFHAAKGFEYQTKANSLEAEIERI